jgi:hypothetical protein
MASYYDLTVKSRTGSNYRVVVEVGVEGREAEEYVKFFEHVLKENNATDYFYQWSIEDGKKILHRKPKGAMTVEQFKGSIF